MLKKLKNRLAFWKFRRRWKERIDNAPEGKKMELRAKQRDAVTEMLLKEIAARHQ